MRYWMPLFAILSLTGCVTAQQTAQEADDAKCRSYGVPKGSPEYVQCRMLLDQQRADRRLVGSTGLIGTLQNLSER